MKHTDTHLCIVHGERERHIYWREAHLFLGLVFYLLYILYRGSFCWVFFPMRVSQDKSLCSFCVVVLVYLSVIFWLMVMLL